MKRSIEKIWFLLTTYPPPPQKTIPPCTDRSDKKAALLTSSWHVLKFLFKKFSNHQNKLKCINYCLWRPFRSQKWKIQKSIKKFIYTSSCNFFTCLIKFTFTCFLPATESRTISKRKQLILIPQLKCLKITYFKYSTGKINKFKFCRKFKENFFYYYIFIRKLIICNFLKIEQVTPSWTSNLQQTRVQEHKHIRRKFFFLSYLTLISLESSFQSSTTNLTNEFCYLVENICLQNNSVNFIDSWELQVIKGSQNDRVKAGWNCFLNFPIVSQFFFCKKRFTAIIIRPHLISWKKNKFLYKLSCSHCPV